jgi:hypothetical protein
LLLFVLHGSAEQRVHARWFPCADRPIADDEIDQLGCALPADQAP